MFLTIVPLNGQKQESTGWTWQDAVTVFPVLSIAEQLVQRNVTDPLAGEISNAVLSSIAPKLPSKSIFFLAFFTANPLSRPYNRGRLI